MSTTTTPPLGTCATTDFVRCRGLHAKSQFCTGWVSRADLSCGWTRYGIAGEDR